MVNADQFDLNSDFHDEKESFMYSRYVLFNVNTFLQNMV